MKFLNIYFLILMNIGNAETIFESRLENAIKEKNCLDTTYVQIGKGYNN